MRLLEDCRPERDFSRRERGRGEEEEPFFSPHSHRRHLTDRWKEWIASGWKALSFSQPREKLLLWQIIIALVLYCYQKMRINNSPTIPTTVQCSSKKPPRHQKFFYAEFLLQPRLDRGSLSHPLSPHLSLKWGTPFKPRFAMSSGTQTEWKEGKGWGA